MASESMRDGCETCRLVERRDAGEAPPWDRILRTDCWDLVHAFGCSLPGWLVLVSRSHADAIHELSPAAAAELGPLLHQASVALREATGCAKTYVMQFAEAPGHGHVHFHVVPRMPDQPAEVRGARIFAYLGAGPDEQVSEAERNRVAERVREAWPQPTSSTTPV